MSDGKTVAFSEWQKLDLRVARIREVKDHPQADKLYLLRVDLGSEERWLVAGLKPYYKKEELENKLCIVFTNLEAALIRGVKSEGMLLAAGDKEQNRVLLISPEKEIRLGSKVT